jgi:signal transduction histidine kinase
VSGPSLIAGKECVQIIIEDNGIGFDQEYAQKIFKTFTRLNAKDKYEGTGLGLSLCQKIVQRHNGIIYAKAMLNEGATFTITLPLKQNN